MTSKIISKLKNNTLFRLDNKVAIVTGGAQGIGLSIARGFAYSGCKVSICDTNMESATKESQRINDELNGNYSIPIKADVTKERDIQNMIDLTVKEFGSLNVAMNNAGMVISGMDNHSQNVSERDYDAQCDLNIKAIFRCCQKEGDYMIKNKIENGKIINMASMSSFVVNHPQQQSVYNLTKAAVVQMTRSLAVEWSPHQIYVNCISPGYTLTPLLMQPELKDMRKLFADGTPMKRLADPDEIIGAALYLAGDASSFTTGIQLVVAGGYDCI